MRHSEQFVVLFLPISFFTYLSVRLPMKPKKHWKGYLENKMRWGDTWWRWSFSHWIKKASTISKISLQNSRIYCCNSKLAWLINRHRRNKWFSPFSPSLVLNYLYLYPHSTLSNSPLEPTGRFLLLRTLLNPWHKRKLSSSTWAQSKAQGRMKSLCTS